MTEMQVVKFDIETAAIAKMSDVYMKLKVSGPDDEEGFQAVHDGRMVVKKHRVSVDKREKALKADANVWRKKVGDKAKELRALLEPIETHLTDQEKIVTDEKKRIEEEKKRKFQEKIDNRVNKLASFGPAIEMISYQDLAVMSDEEFAEKYIAAKRLWEDIQSKKEEEERIELERLAKEAADRKAENERLEKIRIEQEEAAAKIKAEQYRLVEEQSKIDEEKNKIAREKQAEIERKEREAFEKQAKEDARIQAEKDAKEAAERAELEKAELEKAEREQAERREALKPDREKLEAWVDYLCKVPMPEVECQEALDIVEAIHEGIGQILATYQPKINAL